MITLKQLQWSNLFSYGSNNTLDLVSSPITQLVGLNGHGKSSIPLVLEETLFNKNSKSIKKADIPNRELDSNKYSSSCIFDVDGVEYSLSISRSGNVQKVKLLKDSIDISSHTATDTFKEVEKLFGLDFKTFSQLVYQNNASSLSFLTATDTNRKKFLIELLSLDRYLVLYETIKVVHKEVSDLTIKLESKLKTIKEWLSNIEKFDTTKLSLVAIPELNIEDTETLAKLEVQLSEINSINSKIQNNNKYLELLQNIPVDSLIIKDKRIDTKSIESKISEFTTLLKQDKAIVTKFSSIHEGECPTCLQTINRNIIDNLINSSKLNIAKYSEEVTNLQLELAEVTRINQEISDREKLIADFEKYSTLVDKSLSTSLLDKDSISKDIANIRERITNINISIKKASEYNNSVVTHNAKVESILVQIDQYKKELIEVETEYNTLSSKLDLLEVLKKAFSTSGLIAYKIESSVKELEELTNDYLSELSDGRFQLSFELLNDKLNVVIIDNGNNIDITALSAGELARVSTATLLAIRKLMHILSKTKINVLFLDETLDVLDSYGKEKLIEVLLNEEELNTFIISHSYSHPLVQRINIIKENGISRLENG